MSAYYYATLEQNAALYNNRYDVTEGKAFIYKNPISEKKIIKYANNLEIELGDDIQKFVKRKIKANSNIFGKSLN